MRTPPRQLDHSSCPSRIAPPSARVLPPPTTSTQTLLVTPRVTLCAPRDPGARPSSPATLQNVIPRAAEANTPTGTLSCALVAHIAPYLVEADNLQRHRKLLQYRAIQQARHAAPPAPGPISRWLERFAVQQAMISALWKKAEAAGVVHAMAPLLPWLSRSRQRAILNGDLANLAPADGSRHTKFHGLPRGVAPYIERLLYHAEKLTDAELEKVLRHSLLAGLAFPLEQGPLTHAWLPRVGAEIRQELVAAAQRDAHIALVLLRMTHWLEWDDVEREVILTSALREEIFLKSMLAHPAYRPYLEGLTQAQLDAIVACILPRGRGHLNGRIDLLLRAARVVSPGLRASVYHQLKLVLDDPKSDRKIGVIWGFMDHLDAVSEEGQALLIPSILNTAEGDQSDLIVLHTALWRSWQALSTTQRDRVAEFLLNNPDAMIDAACEDDMNTQTQRDSVQASHPHLFAALKPHLAERNLTRIAAATRLIDSYLASTMSEPDFLYRANFTQSLPHQTLHDVLTHALKANHRVVLITLLGNVPSSSLDAMVLALCEMAPQRGKQEVLQLAVDRSHHLSDEALTSFVRAYINARPHPRSIAAHGIDYGLSHAHRAGLKLLREEARLQTDVSEALAAWCHQSGDASIFLHEEFAEALANGLDELTW